MEANQTQRGSSKTMYSSSTEEFEIQFHPERGIVEIYNTETQSHLELTIEGAVKMLQTMLKRHEENTK
ncbi:hypothetical protein KSB_75370 [Ktedonobacter robiniae]|uniref:Uncharacterized protein n=2 Tax=Ktedonobacteraceae TaxID=388449 RepID=A0ABQ3V290_9CHLR|nr:hypothetical protein KSB_75370 [Ktedonobacter robiniae]GHO70703.1 hypothetical protein KSC_095950 [Ktedonobacter sp. SOSP1-52]